MAQHTTVAVPQDLRDDLKALKRGGESYADVIRRLKREHTDEGQTHN